MLCKLVQQQVLLHDHKILSFCAFNTIRQKQNKCIKQTKDKASKTNKIGIKKLIINKHRTAGSISAVRHGHFRVTTRQQDLY